MVFEWDTDKNEYKINKEIENIYIKELEG